MPPSAVNHFCLPPGLLSLRLSLCLHGVTPPALSPPSPTPFFGGSRGAAGLGPVPCSGRISTRTCRKTAATACAGVAQPAVDFGFGLGRVSRSFSFRPYPPPRVPPPRPSLVVASGLSWVPTPVPTAPIPSDRDRAKPLSAPFLGLPTPSGPPPSALTADLDALGTAAEFHFADFTARCSHADMEGEQQAEPSCYDAIQYILLGRPLAMPTEVLARFPSHQRPSFLEIQELAGKGRLHTTDGGIVFVVRIPTPTPYPPRPAGRATRLLGDEPVSFYVPLRMRPWIMQACHSIASCHLGTASTLRMLERFCWWIKMSISNRWWLRHYLKYQARKTPPLTVRWPVISTPLPPGPGIAVSMDCFRPTPVTPRGNTCILFFTNRFSRRTDMSTVAAAQFIAESTANALTNRHIPSLGMPA